MSVTLKTFFLTSLFCLAINLFLYGPGINNGFVYDDAFQILENHWIEDWGFLPTILSSGVWDFLDFPSVGSGYYRPLMHVFFMLEYHLFGLDPTGYHVMSIVMHGLNASLLFLFVYGFLGIRPLVLPEYVKERRYGFALLVALIFLVHPVNSEVVYWASAAPELLFVGFSLLTLLSFFFLTSLALRLGLALAFFTLAFLSKETAIMLPVVLFLLQLFLWTDRSQSFFRRMKTTLLRTSPFFIVGVILLVLRSVTMTPSLLTDPPSWDNWLPITLGTLLEVFLGNVALLFRLMPLSIFHGYNPSDLISYSALAIAFGITVLGGGYWAWRKQYSFPPLLILGSTLFLLFLLPALNYFHLGGFVLSERYLYMPSTGFALLLATLFFWIFERIQTKFFQSILVLAVWSMFIWFAIEIKDRAVAWQDTVTLLSTATELYPESPDPRYPLFQVRCQVDIGQCQHELDLFCSKVIERYPSSTREDCLERPNMLHFLARTYLDAKEWDQAETYYTELLAQKPELGEAWWGLGVIALKRDKNLAVAEEYLAKAQVFAPKSLSVYQSLLELRCRQGNREAARKSAAQALQYGAKQEMIDEILRTCQN